MTLVSESGLKNRVGVSGTENSSATLRFTRNWRSMEPVRFFDASNRKLSVAICAFGLAKHTYTHALVVTHEVERRSWIG